MYLLRLLQIPRVIKHSLVPAQTGLETSENANIKLNRENVKMRVKNVVSNSFAFGGNNTSIIVGECR